MTSDIYLLSVSDTAPVENRLKGTDFKYSGPRATVSTSSVADWCLRLCAEELSTKVGFATTGAAKVLCFLRLQTTAAMRTQTSTINTSTATSTIEGPFEVESPCTLIPGDNDVTAVETRTDGATEGVTVGALVGASDGDVDGSRVGSCVGVSVVGESVGVGILVVTCDGDIDGIAVGTSEGALEVGIYVGTSEGASDGAIDGISVGTADGITLLGALVGAQEPSIQ